MDINGYFDDPENLTEDQRKTVWRCKALEKIALVGAIIGSFLILAPIIFSISTVSFFVGVAINLVALACFLSGREMLKNMVDEEVQKRIVQRNKNSDKQCPSSKKNTNQQLNNRELLLGKEYVNQQLNNREPPVEKENPDSFASRVEKAKICNDSLGSELKRLQRDHKDHGDEVQQLRNDFDQILRDVENIK